MSTDAHYDARSYDILTNFPVNHEYRWLILNRGLIVGKKKHGEIVLIGKLDSALIGSTYNKKIVGNIFLSQKFHPWYHYLM